MDLIERLYAPTAKDMMAGIRQQRLLFSGSAAASAAAVSFSAAAVPADTARFITMVSFNCTAGATQFLELVQAIVIVAGGGVPFAVNQSPPTRNAATLVGVAVPCGFVLLPGEVLQMQGQFNAGVNSNTINGFAFGWDIPRANLI